MELTPLRPPQFCLCGQIQAARVAGSALTGDRQAANTRAQGRPRNKNRTLILSLSHGLALKRTEKHDFAGNVTLAGPSSLWAQHYLLLGSDGDFAMMVTYGEMAHVSLKTRTCSEVR